MTRKHILVSYKGVLALLGFSAYVTEIAVLIERGDFNFTNFFSYFTIESNILLVFSLLIGASAIAAGSKSRFVDYFRGAVVFYMVTVGVIFSLLLSGYVALTAVPWDNIVLHYIMPIVALVDWIIDPPKSRVDFKKALSWLIFPVVYLGYSLIRGMLTDWYPYPFLNIESNGVAGVALVSAGILVFGVIVIYVLTHMPKHLQVKR